MLEQLNDPDRYETVIPEGEFLLHDLKPLSQEAIATFSEKESDRTDLWLPPKTFHDREKRVSGIVFTKNSIFYRMAVEQHLLIEKYNMCKRA